MVALSPLVEHEAVVSVGGNVIVVLRAGVFINRWVVS